MSQIVACPGCKKQYKIGPSAAGQRMKCPACQTVFSPPAGTPAVLPPGGGPVTVQPGPKPAETGKPKQANDPAMARFGVSAPLAESPRLFPGELPDNAPDPLANHVVQDPGFVDVDIEEVRKKRIQRERKESRYLDDDPLEKFRRDSLEQKSAAEDRLRQSRMTIWFGIGAALVFAILVVAGYFIGLNSRPGAYFVFYTFIAAAIVFIMVDLLVISYVKLEDPDNWLWYAILPPYRIYYWFGNWKKIGGFVIAELVLLIPLVANGILMAWFSNRFRISFFDIFG